MTEVFKLFNYVVLLGVHKILTAPNYYEKIETTH